MKIDQVDAYKHLMSEAFSNSRHYVSELDNLLKDRLKKTFDGIADEVTRVKAESFESVAIYWEDQIEFDSITSPMYYFNWAFAHSYATFELYLRKLCELHYDEQKLTIKDLKGANEVDIQRKYLEKVCELPLSDLNPMFDQINEYRLIRNSIVHSLSDLRTSNEKEIEKQDLFRIIKKHYGIGISARPKGHFYISESKFIEDFSKMAEDLLRRILKEVRISQ